MTGCNHQPPSTLATPTAPPPGEVMSRKPCPSRKVRSPMFDTTASDLFDDLFRKLSSDEDQPKKPSSADKAPQASKRLSQAEGQGAEVTKKVAVTSHHVSRYNYSYSPRCVHCHAKHGPVPKSVHPDHFWQPELVHQTILENYYSIVRWIC